MTAAGLANDPWQGYHFSMASVLDSVELLESADQTAFNLAVWKKVLADSFFSKLPHRIETDRFGQLIMSWFK